MIGRYRRRRDDHVRAVTLERRGDGEPHAGVAARTFHDRPAGLELPLAFGLLDDGQADAVLHRATGIEELRLAVHGRADAARHAMQANEWRPADRLEDGV